MSGIRMRRIVSNVSKAVVAGTTFYVHGDEKERLEAGRQRF
jgi:hypothetical protein